jgi:hypothetical protein
MEQLFIGNTAMTQVIGSAQFLSTGEYTLANNINRDTIDSSSADIVKTNVYGEENE